MLERIVDIKTENQKPNTENHVLLPAEEVEVRDTFDVIVVGGGLSGTCAAIASARLGAKTLLAESLPFIGGNGTIGLPMTSFRAYTYKHPHRGTVVVKGIPLEILDRLRERGGIAGDPAETNWMDYDSDLMGLVITDMVEESGVHLLCHAPLMAAPRTDTAITHAVFLGKDEKIAHEGTCFVDASGDAALAYKAGLDCPMGRARDGKTQPLTMIFTVSNVDQEAFKAADGYALMRKEWDRVRETTELLNPRTGKALSGPIWLPSRPDHVSFNVTRILVEKGTDSHLLTEAEIIGRRQVEEFMEKLLRPFIPGFENCALDRVAHRVGVRETRRVRGEYELTDTDLIECTKFPDAVACNSYPVDIHSPTGGDTEYQTKSMPEGGYYTVPYRSLVAKEIDNLLAAGRCLSATHEGISAVRVNSCAMPTGQAAGTAAALCAQQSVPARELDSELLRDTLRQHGAIVD